MIYTSYPSNELITVAQSSILQVTAWSDILVFLATDMAEALLELIKDIFIQVILNSDWLTNNKKLFWDIMVVNQNVEVDNQNVAVVHQNVEVVDQDIEVVVALHAYSRFGN